MKNTAPPRYPQVILSDIYIRDRVRIYLSEVRKSIITTEDVLWSFPEMENEPMKGRDRWRWCAVKRQISFTLKEAYPDQWVLIKGHAGSPKRWERVKQEGNRNIPQEVMA